MVGKDLEVRHCRILVAVAETGGIAAAARALGLAQSTVSEALLSLERVLGTQVTLRRPGREAVLTPAASSLLPHARALVSSSEAALAALSKESQSVIRVGAVESISSFLLPGPLASFRSRWPQCEVRIAIGLCEDLRRRVHRSELDAALAIEGDQSPLAEEIGSTRKLSPASMRFVAAPGSPLAAAPVGRSEMRGKTFLLADANGAFNKLLNGWFEGHANSMRLESAGSVEGVKRGVRNSEAIGVLPAYAVAEELTSRALVGLKLLEDPPAIALMLTVLKPPLEDSPLHDLITLIGDAFAGSS